MLISRVGQRQDKPLILNTLMLASLILVCACLALSGQVAASELGNSAKGKIYAEEVCAKCHSVTADQHMSPRAGATAFQAIADTPGMTRTALIVFFRTPHRSMPNLIIAGEDADNIIAYILSLKGKK